MAQNDERNDFADLARLQVTPMTGGRIVASRHGDVLLGSRGSDNITGGAGNDIAHGEGGHDALEGGQGHDELNGDNGNDYISGGAGHDTLSGGEGVDTLVGGAGADHIRGHAGDDVILSGAGDDEAYGGMGNDTIYDIDYGGLYGQQGDDHLIARSGKSHLIGGDGNDVLDARGTSSTHMKGERGNDTLIGGSGRDYMEGGIGRNLLQGGAGPDVYVIERRAHFEDSDIDDPGLRYSGSGPDDADTIVGFNPNEGDSLEVKINGLNRFSSGGIDRVQALVNATNPDGTLNAKVLHDFLKEQNVHGIPESSLGDLRAIVFHDAVAIRKIDEGRS